MHSCSIHQIIKKDRTNIQMNSSEGHREHELLFLLLMGWHFLVWQCYCCIWEKPFTSTTTQSWVELMQIFTGCFELTKRTEISSEQCCNICFRGKSCWWGFTLYCLFKARQIMTTNPFLRGYCLTWTSQQMDYWCGTKWELLWETIH